ncbi:MAG: NAD/NADP octopine/nopaline dehydrogenase family protein [Muribaculaceae bacterium]|nr:NAD/NADP octopine/nopaline dehydrogenase family protein [Muribaculaceae bacterium]
MKKICICGGGNLGLVCAGVLASRDYEINILTGHPDSWSRDIRVFDPDGKEFTGAPELITSDPQKAVASVDMVLLCLPGYLIEQTLKQIKPFISHSCIVGAIVASTGFFFFAHDLLPGQPIFGFQRVPYICRTIEYGRCGRLLGYKKSLSVAAENIPDVVGFIDELEQMFETPVSLLDTFYEAALTNSNPILHTSRLFSMWGGEVKPIPHQSKFYSEWTDRDSKLMIEMDSEFQTLLRALNVREGAVPTLLDYYESTDAVSLTRKIRSIEAFKPILTPMIETPDGWLPDYHSRYFTEDFPFGLRFIKELADKKNIPVPRITEVLSWGLSKRN